MKLGLVAGGFGILLSAIASDLEDARDRQDVATLEARIAELSKTAAAKPDDADAQYHLALAHSYLSEVAFELRDKAMAKAAAEAGIHAAERAVTLQGDLAEHHRILGTLCGQVIPSNVLSAFKYGKCAMTSIHKALELAPNSSQAYLSRGVGNYYLPAAVGGGMERAARDFEKAVRLNSKSADAYLWLGIALRRMSRNSEAKAAIRRSLELNPRRVWAKQQLDKTPAE